jgi:hypothetical protein
MFLQQLARLCDPPGEPGPWAEAMGEK